MRPAEDLNDSIKKLELKASADLDARVHDDISGALAGHEKPQSARPEPNIWRTIMKGKTPKLAVAAVILIAVAISVTILDKSVTPAYAIEQTIEASRSLRFIHLKIEPAAETRAEGVDEMWAAFDAEGNLHRLRLNFPKASGGKVVVWQEGKAEVWFKAKNTVAVVREEDMHEKLKMAFQDLDPKLIVQQLCQMQASDEEQIKIHQPPSEAEPIIGHARVFALSIPSIQKQSSCSSMKISNWPMESTSSWA
ncbi:MAG: hypothetical protein ACYSUD_17645 [Planctomycetota bacterium]|jgi:hypothetical protein